MKIRFDSVRLDESIALPGAPGGLATSDSTHNGSGNGCIVDYDTATGLVSISRGVTTLLVPVHRVKWFVPLAEVA